MYTTRCHRAASGGLGRGREPDHPRAHHRGDGRPSFVGTPDRSPHHRDLVQEGAADGFILVPHITPGGLDEFADTVVPILQERGPFRTDYEGPTLRDHLGLAGPAPRPRGADAE